MQPYTVVVNKDMSGFYNEPIIGLSYKLFLGVSPNNPNVAVVATTRQDVVGMHRDVPIVSLPVTSIGFESLDMLIPAPYEVLVKLGLSV